MVAVVSVRDEDEVLMMTSRGKIQRVAVREIKPIGRNTQGVRIMRLDEGDSLAAVVRVPPDDRGADSPESTEEPADPSPQV